MKVLKGPWDAVVGSLKNASQWLVGEGPVNEALALGESIRESVHTAIASGPPPPLRPRTIRAKTRAGARYPAKPLVYTGWMSENAIAKPEVDRGWFGHIKLNVLASDRMHPVWHMPVEMLLRIHEFGRIDGSIPARPVVEPIALQLAAGTYEGFSRFRPATQSKITVGFWRDVASRGSG